MENGNKVSLSTLQYYAGTTNIECCVNCNGTGKIKGVSLDSRYPANCMDTKCKKCNGRGYISL